MEKRSENLVQWSASVVPKWLRSAQDKRTSFHYYIELCKLCLTLPLYGNMLMKLRIAASNVCLH